MSTQISTTGTRAGCGCGGGCGGPSAAPMTGASAFVRPRFFGGMLLTEDDLQAIDDYTLAKRKLTNRHLFGPGVVCGLEVDCDPCRPGWLTVTPGYALDCCGNDIVVGCPVKLDALELLSELRRRSPADCGEPCDDRPARDYLLTVAYDEQPTDAVAPYSQDDCAVGDCDFSRVREGYRFELVCEVAEPDPTLFDRLRDCVKTGDEETKEDTGVLVRLARLANAQATVAETEATGQAPEVAVPTEEELQAAGDDIGAAVPLLGRATTLLAAAAAHDAKLGPASGLTKSRRRLLSTQSRALAERLLGSDQLRALPETERRRVTVVLEAARDQQGLERLSVGQRLWLAEGYDPVEAERSFVEDAERIRARVLKGFEASGRGNCQERSEVERLPLQRLDARSSDAVRRLGQSYLTVVAGCLCDVVNPPCPTCTETRVPLALVRIEDCEVVDVCGLARQWVPAPRTLNYWVPIVDLLRRLLLSRCCRDRVTKDRGGWVPSAGREVGILQEQALQALALLRSPADAPEFQELLEVLNEPVGAAKAAPQGAPSGPPTPAPDPGGADEVADLKQQLAVLQEQVAKLSAGGRP
jgi:hypothetical protein